MKPSRYLKVYPYKEKPGYLLLYSTKKTSMILLREETYGSALNGTLSADNEKKLTELGMIVPDRDQEKREVLGLIDKINENIKVLRISVILNLECNFDCIYCYEGDLKGSHYMAAETAALLTEFIKTRFTPEKEKIRIDYYGGEPLLSMDLIRSISSEVKSFAEGRGAGFAFSLVTNGSLFRRKIAEDLVSIGLSGIKVTIDGPPDIHNKCRPFKNGAGSFDVILRNIKETTGLVRTRIGGNYQKGNFMRFPELIDRLQDEGLTPDRVYQLKFDPVMNRPGSGKASPDYTDGLMSINEPWVIKATELLRGEVMRRGYDAPKLQPTPCQVEINDSFVVNYDGVIYKCPVFIGKEGYGIGDLSNGIKEQTDIYRPGIWKRGECEECEYLPLCFGGCRYMSYARDGNMDRVDCRKPYLDAVLETLIKQDIKYRPGNDH